MEYFSKSFHKGFRRLFFPSGYIVSFPVRKRNLKSFLSDPEDQFPISDKYVSDYNVTLKKKKKKPLYILSGFSQDKQYIFMAILNNMLDSRSIHIGGAEGIFLSPGYYRDLRELFVAPWTVVHEAPLAMEFSRKDYWSGLPFPPGDLPNPGTQFLSLNVSCIGEKVLYH